MSTRTRKPEPQDESDDAPEPREVPELRRSRVLLTLTSSYGISLLLHVILILIMASIVIFYQEPQVEAVVLARREHRDPDYNEQLPRDTRRRPDVPNPQETPNPPVRTVDPPVDPQEIPRGTDLDNQSSVNLESSSFVDAYGIGGGRAGAYGPRWGHGPAGPGGGGPRSEDAVLAALRWLARHQSPDGGWDSDGFFANCHGAQCTGPSNAPAEGGPGGRGPGRGYARFDAGVTGLAMLAFLGQGHTHHFGDLEFREVMRKAVAYLVGLPGLGHGIQAADGSLGFRPDDPETPENEGESIYNHAIATMAICETYAMTRDPLLRPKAEAAVRFCLQAQNPGYGWRYGVALGDNDTSVTGWMVLALKAAKVAGFEVPQGAFDGARAWFDRCTVGFSASNGRFDGDADRAGEVGYMTPGDGGSILPPNADRYVGVPTMTAVSTLCRIFTGQRRNDDVVRRGARILMDSLPVWGSRGSESLINEYYWYYGTYAMFQVGGDDWLRWNEAMLEALLGTQRMGGDEDGSWDPIGEWGLAGGRVYTTALGALTLEIYYRYERAQEEGRH